MPNRDWREYAYLTVENWPEAIPPLGPKREYDPYPWNHIPDDDLDSYPTSHPNAASIGEFYLGDVCPYCGVPIHYKNDRVVLLETGEESTLMELEDDITEPKPAYHRLCYYKRQHRLNTTLDEWAITNDA